MDLGLRDKRVIITGGSRGIGLACAELFLQEGCEVTIVGRNAETLAVAEASLSARGAKAPTLLPLDLAVRSDVEQLFDHIPSADILVNSAGAIPGGGFEQIDDARWRDAWELKVFGYLNTTREAYRIMTERGHGVIVNIVGIAGANPRYDYLCGSAGNAALIAFTKAAGAKSSLKGVRIVGVNPGPTRTERLMTLYRARAKQHFGDEERWGEMLQHLPFGRAAEPGEMADLVVFLASRRASYISGAVIDADGGGMYL